MIRALAFVLCLAGAARADLAAEAERLAGPGTAAVVAVWTPDGTEIAVAGRHHADGPMATEDDAWHVGSLAKAMTATLAARLVADGAIGWDARTGDRLPDAGNFSDVTLAEWLTHRSGMAANLSVWRTLMNPDRAAYVAQMLAADPAGPRGEFLYSNAGYVVAGAMLEAATGETWETLIAREVFEPLGMDGAGFGPPDGIRGHGPFGLPVVTDNIAAMGPAGTVHLPAGAMLRFLAAHATRDPGYLPPELWHRLHEPVGDYAMGWGVADGALSHSGSNTFWFARVRVAPGRAVFVAVNSGDAAVRTETERVLTRLAEAGPPATPAAPRP